ncbi:MAG: GGDEF domain-containing protein [Candidatus Edwardsbacteria bacterium]|nr:GGDEF domain-containing protein [Candidatus Edwardsbacteria bacterium]
MREKLQTTAAYIDLDNFKTINDSFGHSTGDDILKLIANIMNSIVRQSDIIARAGGDEFIIFLPNTGYDAAHIILERIRKRVAMEMQQNGWNTTLSIGAVTCRSHPGSVDTLVSRIDALMYEVKRAGKDGFKHIEYSGKQNPQDK